MDPIPLPPPGLPAKRARSEAVCAGDDDDTFDDAMGGPRPPSPRLRFPVVVGWLAGW
jgi:hypothetical protein